MSTQPLTPPSPTIDAPRLARLVEISRVLNSATNVDELLHYIIKQAASLTDSEAASILLLDPHTRELHFRAASNSPHNTLTDIPIPLDNSIAGSILQQNRPMLIADVTQDPRWNPDVSQAINFQTKSILGVPMHDADRQAMGVLEALNKQHGRFTRQDAETLTILADIAGVAIARAQLAEALQRAYRELNELDQIKTDFIAVASHELRTPLSVIMGYVSFLREEADPALADQLDTVMDAAVHLRNLIQDMLNLRYVDAGESTLDLQPWDLGQVVRELTAVPDETAVSRRQTITTHLPAAPTPVLIDHDVMHTAFTNLLDNAIKFTPAGGQIDLRLEQRGQEAWFSVCDTGIGIPADKLEWIFKRFCQVEPALRRRYEGLGLGLSIAKDLVELHNGRIWAESTLEQGSTFTVALPLYSEV
ncbi:MAG: GAF domain-containing protein [Ardenticatenaceae bacterium]|nr:GAF domain-containing protein [Ardenticatenaceae bacterium]